MPDKYGCFAELLAGETDDAFGIRTENRQSRIAIVAPHGGGIEPGTSEVVLAVAGIDLSYYLFEGRKAQGNQDLHITSTHFDEPTCLRLLESTITVLTIHGESSNDPVVYAGGLDYRLLETLTSALTTSGYSVRRHASPHLQGNSVRNICNAGLGGAGVQLELSRGLRASFFADLSSVGRKVQTDRLSRFVTCIRDAVLGDPGGIPGLG